MTSHKLIHTRQSHACEFAIATLVTNWDEYGLMKESFVNAGFDEGTEYLVADNTAGNTLDAFEAIAAFLKENRAKYLLVVHQDVRCIDTREMLNGCLSHLDELDPKWAVCGNAGAFGYHNDIIYMNNNGKLAKSRNLPALVNSLDENFLLIKTSANLTVSPDIGGFHLYGTDLAIIADFLGYTCYVIPFLVNHLSTGNMSALMKEVPAFVEKYGRKLRSRFIQTACTSFYLSNSVFKNRLYNSRFMFFWVKALQRFPQLRSMFRHGRKHKKSVEYPEGKPGVKNA